MFDSKKVGIKIASLRKRTGYSQERLADILCVTPQAISKWENGHSLPETSLLPVLTQIFSCTIDEIIMPAYSFDEKIEREKINITEKQAEHIANYIIKRLEDKNMDKEIIGLNDETVINAIRNMHPNIGNCEVVRGKPVKSHRHTSFNVTVSTLQNQFKLIERIYPKKDVELFNYELISSYSLNIPQIYHIDNENNIILIEDLSDGQVQGYQFDEDNDNGVFIRENYKPVLSAAAKLHMVFWENYDAFRKKGLDWRLESNENLLAHISGMEKDYKKYRTNEENGKIPKTWNIFENHIEIAKLDYFQTAIDILREKYTELLGTRFNKGKNITIIHGDMHPGNIFISKSSERTVKFIDLEAVRMGLCTEDLAMLIALHIEPDKNKAMPLLEYYHNCLCEKVNDYPFDIFIKDYKISIMENMFFTIRLINRGIYDFSMRDKAMRAFETFILGKE